MDSDKVRRLYEIRQKIKELENEEEAIKNAIKDEMIKSNTEEAVIGNIIVKLRTQNRVDIDNQIVPYLKENGYSNLIVETCDQIKFKEMLKVGAFKDDYDYIKDYVNSKVIHYLYLRLRGE